MTPTRSELEREVLSLRDRLNVVMGAVVVARNLVVGWVPEETRKSSEYKRLLALVTAVAKENSLGPPLLARLGWQQGMKEAKQVVLETGKTGTDEWMAGCQRASEEIDRKLNTNL